MPGLQLQNISLSFGAREILSGVDTSLDLGCRTALCGENGSGKSTLMKIIAGITPADSGNIVKTSGFSVSYLPQNAVITSSLPLNKEAETAFDPIKKLVEEKDSLATAIASKKEGEAGLSKLLEQYAQVDDKIERSGYLLRAKKIQTVLTGLGFSDQDLNRPCRDFSLGWQMRIALARVLLEEADLLLLDEPTNFLDLEARYWLLDFVKNTASGVLLVSHDRYFLDQVSESVAELFMGRLKIYRGNYSFYEKQRETELATLVAQYKTVEERREQLEGFINRFRAQASKASLVQSRIKELEKLPVVERPPSVKHIHFPFAEEPKPGNDILRVTNLRHSYGGQDVFSNLEFTLARNERLVVVGINGAGKSTLLRILAGVQPASGGKVVYGEHVTPAFYSQDLAQTLDPAQTVFESMETMTPTALFPKLANMLGAFLFRGDDIKKKTSVLSGGEQSRLLLLRLLIKPGNLLILDEPTNHLDMASKEVLLDALMTFSGTIVFVSHDRAFIDPLADKVLEIRNAKARLFHGNYSYYRERIEKENADQNETMSGEAGIAKKHAIEPENDQETAHDAMKKKRALLRKYDREEEELCRKIDSAAAFKKELEERLALPEVYMDGEKMRELKEQIKKTESLEQKHVEDWEKVSQERHKLMSSNH
ncbi:MAG: ABC transporter ATP-binding protein [Spirochaetaceae bacterium]|nr:MAG: ABC transporter ATP-binding protein [Spirochaetaceae bacterium]